VKRLRDFFVAGINEEPSPMGNFLLGTFSVILGLWLLLPPESFAPTMHFDSDVPALWGSVKEWQVGLFILILGLAESLFSLRNNWKMLQHFTILATMWWSFVLFGYLSVLPEATSVPIFGFLTVFSAYRYFLFCRAAKRNLRNKQKIGNI
jgi:hypothetical protein